MKYFFTTILMTLFVISAHPQRLYDNGPIIDSTYPNKRYVLDQAKWNKLNLTYYI